MGKTIEEQRELIRQRGEQTKLLKVTKSPKQLGLYKKRSKKRKKKKKVIVPKPKKKKSKAPKNFYLTDEWRELRNKRLLHDNYTCTMCGIKKNLHVHHLKYASKRYNYLLVDIKYLRTVCKPCHEKIHGREFDS